MALTATALGTAASNTTGTTFAFNCGGSIAVGDIIVVVGSSDNAGSSGARSMTTVMTDAKGHTYANPIDLLNDPGAASAGVQLRMWWARCKVAMITTDQITANFSPTTVAKTFAVWKITAAAGFQPVYRTSAGGTNVTAGTAATVTTASITNTECVLGATGIESLAAITADADTTNGSWSAQHRAVGAGTMECVSQAKIVTATATQTYNVSWAGATDACIAYMVFTEVSILRGRQNLVQRAAVSRGASW